MTTIDLDRRFAPWYENDRSSDVYATYRWQRGSRDWPELLKLRRVVVLAEAGSGKTEEFCERARILTHSGGFAFYATVQDVALDGLDGALGNAERARLANWRQSDQPGWFFIDSIDEARLDNIRLETALRKLADGIDSALRRAHVVLSSRITDWQSRADLDKVARFLPVPPERPKLAPPPPDVMLGQALRGEFRRDKQPDVPSEGVSVFVMAALDEERVRRFASGKGISGVDQFMAALDEANLWSLASRPLDLDWLVTYWREHGRLGSLADMLNHNFRERLRETNPAHAQNDPIDPERALRALERIGSALVFGRVDKLIIPDSDSLVGEHPGFDAAEMLPDWSSEHRRRLMTRAVFDPATFGRVRLHNDNTGEVRSYLCARWLKRRREENCSVTDLLHLLFAESYGIQLIKPSMQQTAAWLAIWDNDVAHEVLKREPLLLLGAGDPASLSLPTRMAALQCVVEAKLARQNHDLLLDQDALRRFSTKDLAPQIRRLWEQHKANEDVRELLLRMIWLGRMHECADLVPEALFGPYTDHHTLVFAGRAAAAIGDATVIERYAKKIKSEVDHLPGWMVWERLDQLFPKVLTISELLNIFGKIKPDVRDETLGLGYHGPRLAERITDRAELERFLQGVLDLLGPTHRSFGQEEKPAEKAYYPVIAAAGQRLLQTVESDEAPLAAIDAALRLGEGHRYRPSTEEARELRAAILSSPQRRRCAFWRAVLRFTKSPIIGGRELLSISDLDFAGWNPGLSTVDVDWLLADLGSRSTEAERVLACRVLMDLWHRDGRDSALLSRILARASGDPALQSACDLWLAPPEASDEERKYQEEHDRIRREREAKEEARDRFWQEFLVKLRADPETLNRQPPPTPGHIDGNLYHLWVLLRSTDQGHNRYGIEDVRQLVPIVGEQLTNAFRKALTAFWRQWKPTLPSARPADQRNMINNADCMGIAGVSIEAKAAANWPRNISCDEAQRATEYAVLEINGLPSWSEPLAERFPTEVSAVLMTELVADIQNTAPRPRVSTLEDLVRATPAVLRCVSSPLFDLLAARGDFPQSSLTQTLTVLVRSGVREQELLSLSLSRFATADPSVAAAYLVAAFHVGSDQALRALVNRLDGISTAEQIALVLSVLPNLFDNSFFRRDADPPSLPFNVLVELIETAFRTVRVEEDNRHNDGKAYTPNLRDGAESARNYLFSQLCNTPGRATFDVLRRFESITGFPVPPERLNGIAFNRAAQDAEHSPWHPEEAYEMERQFDLAPNTPKDLQSVALRRISDLQHSLHHDDFAQGRTLKLLPREQDVQIWAADQLRNRQRRAYCVEREPHVVDEKEPDIRLQARATEACLPLEIKVAESWTLPELEAALTEQLIGRYMRSRNASHGVLLLVHQKRRIRGWQNVDGRWLPFSDVVTLLQKIADARAATAPNAPQTQVAALDVSGIRAQSKSKPRPTRRNARS